MENRGRCDMNKHLFLIFLITVQFVYAETFRAATAEWRPYAFCEKEKVQGVSVDILQHIGKKTGDEFKIELYPAKRLNQLFEQGKIDINFADSPLWNEKTKNPAYAFSESYLSVREYLYFQQEHYVDVRKIDDLYGKRVGITRGYYYEMLEVPFQKDLIFREEAPGNINLIKKLLFGRSDAMVMDDVLFRYLVASLEYDEKDFKRGMKLSDAPLGIKIRSGKKEALSRINRAIRQLKEEGFIETAVSKHTLAKKR